MAVQTAAGAQLRISEASLGGNYDPETGGSLDSTQSDSAVNSYVDVGEVSSLGEFGPEFEEITFTDLGNRNVRKFKGTRNDGSIDISIGQNMTDSGQSTLWEALQGTNKDDDWAFEVELASGDTFYFAAKVMSFTTNVGDPNSVVEGTISLGIQSGSVEMPEFSSV